MAKKAVDSIVTEIRKSLEGDKIILGTKSATNGLKGGRLKKVYLSVNAPANVREDIERYAKLSGTEVIALPYPSDEIGTLCKKPFSISVLGLLK